MSKKNRVDNKGITELKMRGGSQQKVENEKIKEIKHGLFLGLIGLVAFMIYSNSFDCGFHFDDRPNILNNDHIKYFSWQNSYFQSGHSRFIGNLTLALNYNYNELDVWGYHFVNLLIHVFNGCLVYWLSFLLLEDRMHRSEALIRNRRWIAFFTGLLFVAHPVATQSVTYIIQRYASLVTLFYLLTVIFFVLGRMTAKNIIYRYFLFFLSAVSFYLAIHTKENAYTLPIMIFLIEMVFFHKNNWNLSFRNYRLYVLLGIPVLAILGVMSKFSLSVLKPIPPSFGHSYTLTSKSYLFTQFNVIPQYIRMLILPYGQRLDYDFPIANSLTDGLTWLNLGFLLILLSLSLFYINKLRLLSFGMLWFFLTLTIESSIIPISDVIFEHRTYLPSFGLILLIVCGIFLLFRSKQRLYPIAVLGFIGIVFSYLTYERNKIWKTDLTLTLDNLQKAPGKSRTNLNYGLALYDSGNKSEALVFMNKAVKLNPEYYDALNNRGNVLSGMGKIQEALPDYEKCATLKPDDITGLCNLGITYAILKKPNDALQTFDKAIRINPNFVAGYFNRGMLHYNMGKMAEAEKDFVATLKLNPDNADASKFLNLIRGAR